MRNLLKLLLIMFFSQSYSIAYSQHHSSLDSLDVFINSKLKENHISGFSACVIKDSKVIWSDGYGLSDVSENVDFTTNSVMSIASVSKTITATAVMQLWENGKIKLDDDVNNYIPFGIRNPNYLDKPITVIQLLTHTSSIVDGSVYYESYQCGDPEISLEYWLKNYLVQDGKFFNRDENFISKEPGTKNEYSNVGYGVLAYIVETVSKTPFNEYCMKNIFKKLKMENTGWFLSEVDTNNLVRPYIYLFGEDYTKEALFQSPFVDLFPDEKEFPKNKFIPSCHYSTPNYPDGGLKTSVIDLSKFLIAIMKRGECNNAQILNDTTIIKMLTLQIDGNKHQGIGWFKNVFRDFWGHGGNDPGINTCIYFNPQTRIGIIAFQNSNMGNMKEIVDKIYTTILKE